MSVSPPPERHFSACNFLGRDEVEEQADPSSRSSCQTLIRSDFSPPFWRPPSVNSSEFFSDEVWSLSQKGIPDVCLKPASRLFPSPAGPRFRLDLLTGAGIAAYVRATKGHSFPRLVPRFFFLPCPLDPSILLAGCPVYPSHWCCCVSSLDLSG